MKINIKNLNLKQGDFRLHCDLSVKSGEMVALLGPSGSGKTTLLRCIAGFKSQMSGEIHLGNQRIDILPAHKRNVGYLFQDLALFPHLNVEKNILFGMEMHQAGTQEKKEMVEQLLSLMNLEGYEKRSIDQLSGGEKQRVALSRALAVDPDCLLLDEPLSALDSAVRKNLGKEIRRIQKKKKLTSLFVTHDRNEALNLCDRIVIMKDGQILEQGSPEHLYNSPKDPWTAQFIGDGLVLPVLSSTKSTVITALGEFYNLGLENTKHMLIRPEWIDITKKGLVSEIQDREFISGNYLLRVKMKNIIFPVLSRKRYKPKEKIALSISSYHLF